MDNEVKLRKGTIYQCAEYGGFGILDEINMAKNDAVSVLHATLDYRRSIDVPGYDKIDLHSCKETSQIQRFGGNFTVCGFELKIQEYSDELCSGVFFYIGEHPAENKFQGFFSLSRHVNDQESGYQRFIEFFGSCITVIHGSNKTGSRMKIVETGLSPRKAVTMGVVNKTFDIFEKEIVEDIVKTRIPADWTRDDVYER